MTGNIDLRVSIRFNALVSVSENILKHDSSLADCQLDVDLSVETLKKRTDLLRQPEIAARAEEIATNWLSMIERVTRSERFPSD